LENMDIILWTFLSIYLKTTHTIVQYQMYVLTNILIIVIYVSITLILSKVTKSIVVLTHVLKILVVTIIYKDLMLKN